MHALATLLAIVILLLGADDALAAKRRCAALCRDYIQHCMAVGAASCAGPPQRLERQCLRDTRRTCRAAILGSCRIDGDGSHCRAPSTTTTTLPGSAGAPTSPPLPDGVSPVLQVRCLPDDQVEVLTPVVAARPDGLHVQAFDPPPAGEVGLRSVAIVGASWWSGSSGLDGEFVRPVPAGEGRVWCIRGPYQVVPAFQASLTVVDPMGAFVPYALDCAPAEQRSLQFQGFPTSPPTSIEEAVRIFVSGLLPSDTVEQAGYVHADPDGSLQARVVREGRIIAHASVRGDAALKQYVALAGAYCAGTGLAQ